MSKELTFSMMKPNSVKKNVMGEIIKHFEENGLKIAACKMVHIKKEQAEQFYIEHAERPFYGELVEFITSGPVVVMAVCGDNAVAKHRELIGATNPAEAAPNTIRARFGDSVGENAIHGSDSTTSAEREVSFFFDSSELVNN